MVRPLFLRHGGGAVHGRARVFHAVRRDRDRGPRVHL